MSYEPDGPGLGETMGPPSLANTSAGCSRSHWTFVKLSVGSVNGTTAVVCEASSSNAAGGPAAAFTTPSKSTSIAPRLVGPQPPAPVPALTEHEYVGYD